MPNLLNKEILKKAIKPKETTVTLNTNSSAPVAKREGTFDSTPPQVGISPKEKSYATLNDSITHNEVVELFKERGFTITKENEIGTYLLRPGNPTSTYSLVVFKDTSITYVHSSNVTELPKGPYSKTYLMFYYKFNQDKVLFAKYCNDKGIDPSKSVRNNLFWEYDKRGNLVIIISKMVDYMTNALGIALYEIAPGMEHQLAQRNGHILSPIKQEKLIKIMEAHLDQRLSFTLDEDECEQLREALHSKLSLTDKSPFKHKFDVKSLSLLEDTKDSVHLYFGNGILKVQKDTLSLIPYDSEQHTIWKSHILSRDWKGPQDFLNHDFHDFASKISEDKLTNHGDLKKINAERLQSNMQTIGYFLSSFKNPSEAKAGVFIDQKADGNSANGGTGKTLMTQLFNQYRKVKNFPGKSYKSDRAQFFFAKVTTEDNIAVVDDLRQGANLEDFYNSITGDMGVEAKFVNMEVIPFKLAPKFIFTTNYPLRGSGDSDDRRLVIMEFSDNFNAKNTVACKYGYHFFSNDPEVTEHWWAELDSFSVTCIQLYLTHGLIDIPVTYKENRLYEELGEDFVNYLDTHIREKILANNSTLPVPIQYRWKDIANQMANKRIGRLQSNGAVVPYSSQEISNLVRKWAKYYGHKILPSKDQEGRFYTFQLNID